MPRILTLLSLLSLSLCYSPGVYAQEREEEEEDAFFIRRIYDVALTEGRCYDWLRALSTDYGGRLSGSPQAAAAVEYTRQMLDTLGLDSVWLQACRVPHWERGDTERVRIVNSPSQGSIDLGGLALGNSVGTGPEGLSAEVIEVQGLDDLEMLGPEALAGKIVFFNRPMDPTQIRTFTAYGGAVDQRVYGAARAARYGAVAVLVRSITTSRDDVPHTGVTVYEDETPRIPAIAISTLDADLLSGLLRQEVVRVYLQANCRTYPDKLSYNVIGEIKGTRYPEEIILVGGHLDSWDVAGGAHDDGAGCVHAMDVLQVMRRLGYRPQRTLRCVLFMNEENGLRGGLEYARVSNERGEFHLAAIESDAGGFTPRGFSCDGEASIFVDRFKSVIDRFYLLEPYGLSLSKGGSGADIGPLKSQRGLLFGFRPDSQRYFDYHHTANDNFDAVNKRELEMGVAAISSLVYLLDKYGTD
ncbi:MAG: M28 family peptidase [Bacteroidota bacterium]